MSNIWTEEYTAESHQGAVPSSCRYCNKPMRAHSSGVCASCLIIHHGHPSDSDYKAMLRWRARRERGTA
jgi:hypothetical protein